MRKRGLKLFLASVIAVVMVITMMPNLSMTSYAVGNCPDCAGKGVTGGNPTCALSPGDHNGYIDLTYSGLCPVCASSVKFEVCATCSGTGNVTPLHTHNSGAYGTSTTQHWTKCTDDEDNNGTAVDHTWSDGQCSVCQYTCTHTGMTTSNATCPTCGKTNPDYQGQGGSGGSTPTPSPSSDSKTSEPAKSEIEEREALEEGMSVEPVTVDVTQFSKADSDVVPGTTYNLSNFMTTKGIVKGINAAVAASNKSDSKTVTIYSRNPLCFNETIIKAIQNGKKDVVYYFTYNGHLYSVTVPASVDASKVLEEAGVAGPLYVGKQLGTTRLIK